MEALVAILSATAVQIAIALSAVGLVVALLRVPKCSSQRYKVIWAIGASAFIVLAVWTMRQQSNILAGSITPSDAQPVAVAFKGTIRHVSQVQAYRYDSAMWTLLTLMLAFAAIHKISGTSNEA